MRIASVKKRIDWKRKALFSVVDGVSDTKIPDVAFVMSHRPELFGRAFSNWMQAALRGESVWTVCERELFASFTSLRLFCVF